jgi:hypothetical protein
MTTQKRGAAMLRRIGSIGISVVCLGTSGVVEAGLINGSFESGLTGWSIYGGVATRENVGPYDATHGTSLGVLEYINIVPPPTFGISEALGLPLFTVVNPYFGELGAFPEPFITTDIFELLRQDFGGALDGCYAEPYGHDCLIATGMAMLYQSFNVTAGQRLSFNWNFIGNNPFGAPGISGAYAAFATLSLPGQVAGLLLNDNWGNVLPLTEQVGPIESLCVEIYGAACLDFNDATFTGASAGYQRTVIPIHSTGLATLGFVVRGANQPETGDAMLLLDNIRLSSVPEPSSALLLLAAILALSFTRRLMRTRSDG